MLVVSLLGLDKFFFVKDIKFLSFLIFLFFWFLRYLYNLFIMVLILKVDNLLYKYLKL